MEQNNRGSWGTNFGFLMAAIGSAIGLGNIWGFPYKCGMNGGFAFVVVYLLLVVFIGFVVMLGELVIGRKTGLGVVGAYTALSKKYKWVGYMGVASGFIILGFYNVLGGIVCRYCFGFLMQMFGADGFSGQGLEFWAFIRSNPSEMLLGYLAFTIINMVIVMGGIQSGIEKFTTIAMPALFAILIGLIIYVACQPGAVEGYKFMWAPNLEPLKTNFLGVIKTAAGQMFFSLSLGMGAMITYGSYLSKKENLQKNSMLIPIADTSAALLAAMVVLPACAAFGVEYSAGPGLLFVSMQTVFHNMGGFVGNLVGFLFYFLVFIAAITSSISLLEVCTTYVIDKRLAQNKKPARKMVTLAFAAVILVLGLPVVFDGIGYGIANGASFPTPFELFGLSEGAYATWNDCWLDLYDLISEGILMPLGAMVMSLLIGWKLMPNWKNRDREMILVKECEESGHKFWGYSFFELGFKFIVPVGMIIVLFGQISDFFGL
jgi:NSS family neurotransmitter:Na+ symporter